MIQESDYGPGEVTVTDSPAGEQPRHALASRRGRGERFHGFGEQFAPFDLAGRRIPIVVREQGGWPPSARRVRAGDPEARRSAPRYAGPASASLKVFMPNTTEMSGKGGEQQGQ